MIVSRWFTFWTLVILFIASLTVLLGLKTSAQSFVTIEGRAVNMTEDGTVPSGLEITLHIIDEHNQIDLFKVDSETDGTFSFAKVLYVEQLNYIVAAVYEGVMYARDVEFGNDENSLPEAVELVVYHSTPSQDTLRILDSVFLVTGADHDSEIVRVFERLTLLNWGDRTYVPDLDEPQQMNFLRFSLPRGTIGLDVRTELRGGRVLTVDRGFALTIPVTPGEHHIGFAYNAPHQRRRLAFTRSFPWGAEIFRVLIPQSIGTLDGVGLDQVGPVNIGGVGYYLEEVRDVPYGGEVEIRIGQLPQAVLWKRTWRDFDATGYILLIAPTMIGMVLVVLLAKGLLKGRSIVKESGVRDKEMFSNYSREREALVCSVANLDIKYEKGQIEESEYHSKREEFKGRLLQVAFCMKQEGYGTTVRDDNCSYEGDR